jgi:hypothetical protein
MQAKEIGRGEWAGSNGEGEMVTSPLIYSCFLCQGVYVELNLGGREGKEGENSSFS